MPTREFGQEEAARRRVGPPGAAVWSGCAPRPFLLGDCAGADGATAVCNMNGGRRNAQCVCDGLGSQNVRGCGQGIVSASKVRRVGLIGNYYSSRHALECGVGIPGVYKA